MNEWDDRLVSWREAAEAWKRGETKICPLSPGELLDLVNAASYWHDTLMWFLDLDVDRIRELRRAAGLTQARLAELTGMSCSMIGAIERGERSASVYELASIVASIERVIREKSNDER